MKPVIFNNTVLRDGHQSLAATRMSTEQMIPITPALDAVGFGALETWGGATIDACLRYLGENPFDRLDTLKKLAPKTPHMMLLRGQNIVQYTSFPDDVVEAFVACSAKHGMNIFRIFDALNDTRNLVTCIKAVHKAGQHAQGTICYTTSPVHTLEAFVKLGIELEKIGCDSICIKDMAGLISPSTAGALVKELKAKVKIPIVMHTHNTVGLGGAAYYAAIENGIDAVDCSMAPFANGTGQPDLLMMLAMLDHSDRKPNYDTSSFAKIREHLEVVYKELGAFTSTKNEKTDTEILQYQVPGGMLSNFRNQLKEQNMSDRLDDVLKEIPYVRECLGWIPLVTPTSQIVGTQAMLNVKFGRWKMFSQPAMDVALNKYGRPPGPIDPEVLKLAMEKTGQKPVECRPADLLEPRMPKLKAELKAKGYDDSDENAVLWAMFPAELEKVLKGEKPAAPAAKAAAPSAAAAAAVGRKYVLNIDGARHEVVVEEAK
ncbi:MAG: pyruvate carboxylase subunit B [Chthoniobacteraceae bacterium]|nr:pyruvate carboxylase subunit B [Chthoniobacteraceae bacterium]